MRKISKIHNVLEIDQYDEGKKSTQGRKIGCFGMRKRGIILNYLSEEVLPERRCLCRVYMEVKEER